MKITHITATAIKTPFAQDYWGREAWNDDYEPRIRQGPDLDQTYPDRWRVRHRWSTEISTVLIKLETDEGITGIGESKAPVSPHAVKNYIDTNLSPWLTGKNPFTVKVLWDHYMASMRGRGHIQGLHQEAAAGLDIACWDIIGKASNRPLYEILGGPFRTYIPVYYSGIAGLRNEREDKERERLARSVENVLAQGHNAVKIAIGFGARSDLASVNLVRELAGNNILILVDALGSYDYAHALALSKQLAEAGVGWFETPLRIDDFAGYIELSRHSPIPIANDFLWTVGLLKDLLAQGCRMVCVPETIKSGITETIRIAELADTFGCGFAPHCSIGSTIEFAANAHVAASVPNLVISEYWANDNVLTKELFTPTVEVSRGHIEPPTGPGLGLTINADILTQVSD